MASCVQRAAACGTRNRSGVRAAREVLLRAPIVGSGWSVTRVKGGAWVAHTFNGTRRYRVPPPARELFRMCAPAQPHLTRIPLGQSPWQVSATARGTWVALGDYSHEVEWVPDEPAPQARTVPVGGSSAASRPSAEASGSPSSRRTAEEGLLGTPARRSVRLP